MANLNPSLPAGSNGTNVKFWLSYGARRLEKAGIGSARLDCLILLEDITSIDRAWLLARPEYPLPPGSVKKLEKQITRRANHEPLAYIRGFSEFYGRRFIVNKTVLEPRPESEDIISLLTSLNLTGTPTIVDIGTGSGALAISAKLEIPKATLLATDIDPKCLKVAKANAQMHKAEVMFYKGDLLAAAPSRIIDIIMANLPYVPDSHKINRAAAMEPRTAIFGGSDGLEIYRRLFSGLPTSKPGCILTESLPPQHRKLASIAKSANYRLMKTEGFIQLFVPTP